MKKFFFFILILLISGTLFSSEVLNNFKNAVKSQTTSPTLYSADNETQADQQVVVFKVQDKNYLKKNIGKSKIKNAMNRMMKKFAPIGDFLASPWFLGSLILLILTIIYFDAIGYFKKTPRYSLMAIFSFLLVLAGLVCGLLGSWPLLTTFGILGLVLGTVSYHLIKQSKGDLKGKGFAIASNLMGNLELIALLIFVILMLQHASWF